MTIPLKEIELFKKNSWLTNKKIKPEINFSAIFMKHLHALEHLYLCHREKKLFFNGKQVSLSKQEKIFTLFQFFYQNKEVGLDRNTLIKKIYSPKDAPISDRQLSCYNHNIVKLISRSRKIAYEHFNDNEFSIDWFPYIPQRKIWLLYRPNINSFKNFLVREGF